MPSRYLMQVTATENQQQFIETSIFMLGESAADSCC